MLRRIKTWGSYQGGSNPGLAVWPCTIYLTSLTPSEIQEGWSSLAPPPRLVLRNKLRHELKQIGQGECKALDQGQLFSFWVLL